MIVEVWGKLNKEFDRKFNFALVPKTFGDIYIEFIFLKKSLNAILIAEKMNFWLVMIAQASESCINCSYDKVI